MPVRETNYNSGTFSASFGEPIPAEFAEARTVEELSAASENTGLYKTYSHTINVEIFEDGPNLVILGILFDKRVFRVIQDIIVKMVVDAEDSRILGIMVDMPATPDPDCVHCAPSVEALVGAKIEAGFGRLVREKIGSPTGCTHLSELIMSMAGACSHGRIGYRQKGITDRQEREAVIARDVIEYGWVDTCYAWQTEGPIIRRWRVEHPEETKAILKQAEERAKMQRRR